ncbi:MAG: hypothetical protein FGO69_09145 [Methanobacterium sp.]|nr:MAG: hypothetical protein FGO69_09145 [Methanobacterium sp.]
MKNMVEIKSVELAPFTLLNSSVEAILALISAIILLIVAGIFGAVIPQLGGFITALGVAAIIVFPISTFFFTIMISFFSALLYNTLVPRLGGVKLELEGSDVISIPVVPFALILSAIGAIWAFIVGLFLAFASAPLFALISSPEVLSQALTNVPNATATAIPNASAFAGASIFVALLLIIGLPIVAFVVGFIANALTAIFYNFIAVKVAKLKLEFENVAGTLHELRSIPVVPAALSLAIVQLVWGVISGILNLIGNSVSGDLTVGVISLVTTIIGNFIITFIVVALMAWIYNFLVPKIGGIKLDLS